MSRSIRIRTLPLLLTLSLLTAPAWAAGSAAAAPASPGIPSFFASLWQGLTDLLFGAGPATADTDRMAAALGDLDRAEKTFLEVREDLIARGQRYDAAMVSLDLASLYLQQNRTADLMTIAEEMHALFKAEEVHREALAALLVFQEAARQEQLTAEAAQRFLAVLQRLRS